MSRTKRSMTTLHPLWLAALLTAACSPAPDQSGQPDQQLAPAQTAPGAPASTTTRRVGTLAAGILESSGLCPAPQAGTFFTFGDGGQAPAIFRVDAVGRQLGQFTLGAKNHDWESLSRDGAGNYYLGDCGNNDADRQNLAIIKFRPENPALVEKIKFSYPDQTEFPPAKKQRNFDCEASLWHGGQVYLFTKDRGQQATCKVYTVPDQPGTYVAKLVAKIALPGEVTDAALSPDGRRLVLLARQELFVLDGNSWEELLRATPRRVGLEGAGQTEGVAFKDARTLLISTEEGTLYELGL